MPESYCLITCPRPVWGTAHWHSSRWAARSPTPCNEAAVSKKKQTIVYFSHQAGIQAGQDPCFGAFHAWRTKASHLSSGSCSVLLSSLAQCDTRRGATALNIFPLLATRHYCRASHQAPQAAKMWAFRYCAHWGEMPKSRPKLWKIKGSGLMVVEIL